ncbi:MAG: neutral/alkaline non-lysosomal ceramidase N-terminal domain-containing protein [Phycisphaeraceae bacterium]|nr:neutral/alkaline non-lysosomal ceramidase N-terminal domain-containing protein [Phycisphaeraceae bacterium]
MAKTSSHRQPSWKAGLAKVDITPTEPIWLAGWGFRTRTSQGVSQPIWVKALALRSGNDKPAVWVTADLLGLSQKMTAIIAARVQKKYGIDRSHLVLNASHSHSGPVTGDVLRLYFDLPKREDIIINRYTEWLYDRFVEVVGAALADLSPATLSFGQGLAGIAVNRRRARYHGRSLPTVVDQDVPVLAVHSPAGQLRGVVFGYACHTTCISDDKVNGDYAGYAQAGVEQNHPGAIALFAQGCGGDANPLPRHAPGLGEAYGFILASAVEQVLCQRMKPVNGPLRVAFDEAHLPFESLPTREELLRYKDGPSIINRRAMKWQLSLMKGTDRRPRHLTYPIHVWQFGSDLKIISLSSEPVADYALRFKQTYGSDDTWVAGYSDDYWCYIPSRRVWQEGGYEGFTGMLECYLPGPFSPCVEEIIADKVDALIVETSGSPRPYPRPSKHE